MHNVCVSYITYNWLQWYDDIYIYIHIHTVDWEYVRVPRGVEFAKSTHWKETEYSGFDKVWKCVTSCIRCHQNEICPSVCACFGQCGMWFWLKPGMKFHMQTAAVVIGLLLDRHRTTTTRSFWTQRHERTWRWIAMRRLPSLELAVASIEPLDTAPVGLVAPESIGWTQQLNKMIPPRQLCFQIFQHLHCWPTCTCHPAHKTACSTQFLNSPVLSW